MTASFCSGLHLYKSCYYGISLMGREFCGEKGGSLDNLVCTSHGPIGSTRSALG